MLIRSQDKKSIINLDTLFGLSTEYRTSDRKEYIISAHRTAEGQRTLIAVYSTEEKAIKVLDMIQNAYVGCKWTETHYNVEAQANVPCVIANNVAFQMPTDEEVEG